MGSSEIWDKYHSCCIGNSKFHLASPREIYHTTLMVFIPNFTATHSITSTNTIPVSLPIQSLNSSSEIHPVFH